MTTKETQTDFRSALKGLSTQDFKNLGVQHIAYIRSVNVDSKTFYAVHAADGQKLSIMGSLEDAISATRHNSLEPVTVH